MEPSETSQSAVTPQAGHKTVYSGLSGNEMYCLKRIGYDPGDLLVGNSVYAMGFLGSLRSVGRGLVGGEIKQFTDVIAQGRSQALSRMEGELASHGGVGITGVTSELVMQGSNIEFLSVGSALKSGSAEDNFSTSADGQELYCQKDAGYHPRKFVFGNVAYSIGVGSGVLGSLKSLARGEVREFTQIFTTTRNLALDRIVTEAQQSGANAVVGIETTILPFAGFGVQEMLMIGTASTHPDVPAGQIVTSDLTNQELWNVTNLGYMPQKLLLGTSVYSLGFVGGITSFLKSFRRGEIPELSSLIYEAREESLGKIQAEAEAIGADDVLGIKTYVYELGNGLIEFLAIGTAVKKADVKTASAELIPQAIIQDKDTFSNTAEIALGTNLNTQSR